MKTKDFNDFRTHLNDIIFFENMKMTTNESLESIANNSFENIGTYIGLISENIALDNLEEYHKWINSPAENDD